MSGTEYSALGTEVARELWVWPVGQVLGESSDSTGALGVQGGWVG